MSQSRGVGLHINWFSSILKFINYELSICGYVKLFNYYDIGLSIIDHYRLIINLIIKIRQKFSLLKII